MLKGNIVDIPNESIFFGTVHIHENKIRAIEKLGPEHDGAPYIMPGFIDSHVHIESSMLIPSEFARLAVVHGTVGTISDPHEIANVCGIEGVHYMIDNAKTVPFKCRFGAPSCVPATVFETAGATLGPVEVEALLQSDDIYYLSEVMNFPGVLHKDPDMMQKIALAKKYNKPVDGHAPGLRGDAARQYIHEGISTDHECFTAEEALDKLQNGMKILIREGSAAKNFEALADLLHDHWEQMMFCSDDKHPDSLASGHINQVCERAVARGIDLFKILQAACINPVKHYNMQVGLLQPGDPADCILVKDLKHFQVTATYIDGQLVAENGQSLIQSSSAPVINQFSCNKKKLEEFALPHQGAQNIHVIEALDGQLITNKILEQPLTHNGMIVADVDRDILKIVVVNRYQDKPASISFVKNFGIKKGAIASSVAHDSHNIVAVGVDDASICSAVNAVIASGGGISAFDGEELLELALPVGGLMSTADGYEVAGQYTAIDHFAKASLGATLSAPFMTLSFMALLVIPHLKLSDKGLFDGNSFSFVPVEI